MKKAPLLLFLCLAASAFAQKLPFVVGGVVESAYGIQDDGSDGAGINRMTPFVGVWLWDIGYFRAGYGFYNYSRTDAEKDRLSAQVRTLSLSLGVSLGGHGKPYLIGSFSRAKQLANVGDVTWCEWGAGLGATFQLLPTAAIVTEMEHRWILSHYNPVEDMRVHGTRFQFNVGFVVYVY